MPAISNGTTLPSSSSTIECSGRIQRSSAPLSSLALKRIVFGQGKLRIVSRKTSLTISPAARPGLSMRAT